MWGWRRFGLEDKHLLSHVASCSWPSSYRQTKLSRAWSWSWSWSVGNLGYQGSRFDHGLNSWTSFGLNCGTWDCGVEWSGGATMFLFAMYFQETGMIFVRKDRWGGISISRWWILVHFYLFRDSLSASTWVMLVNNFKTWPGGLEFLTQKMIILLFSCFDCIFFYFNCLNIPTISLTRLEVSIYFSVNFFFFFTQLFFKNISILLSILHAILLKYCSSKNISLKFYFFINFLLLTNRLSLSLNE